MGLSAFNAMRARMQAEAKALGKTSADVEVKEIKPAETNLITSKPLRCYLESVMIPLMKSSKSTLLRLSKGF